MDRNLEERVRDNPSTRLFAPLADSYRKKGRIEEAIEILLRGLSCHPRYISAIVLLARCYEDLGEWEKAREAWESVLNLDDRNLVALRAMGEIGRLLGELDRSRECFRRYLDEFPDDDSVREKLKKIESEIGIAAGAEGGEEDEGDPKKFHLDLEPPTYPNENGRAGGEETAPEGDEETMEMDEEEDLVETITLAEVYAQQGFYERAIGIYRRILAHGPDDGEIMRRIDELTGKLARKREIAEVSGNHSESAILAEPSPPLPEGSVAGGDVDVGEEDEDRETDRAIGPVDINQANVLDLEAIPGVGPVIAQKIVIERERNGPFACPDELDRVPSLGERLIERILPYLTFGEPGSMREPESTAVADEQRDAGGNREGEGAPSGEERPEDDLEGKVGIDEAGLESEFEEFRRWLKNLRK